MNKGTTQYYFPPLTNAQITSLLPSPVEAVCSFQIYPFEPNHAQNINISEVIKLEIRGEFIL